MTTAINRYGVLTNYNPKPQKKWLVGTRTKAKIFYSLITTGALPFMVSLSALRILMVGTPPFDQTFQNPDGS